LEQVLAESAARVSGPPVSDSVPRTGEVRESRPEAGATLALPEGFVAAVAAPTPTPGGGSVAALAAALAAALGEMVCGLTLKRESHKTHHSSNEEALARLSSLRRRLLENVERDAASYEEVRAAMKLPKSTADEKAARAHAIERASKTAALVPLETAELVRQARRTIEALRATTIPQAASDLAVALYLGEAAESGALENVRANLSSISDREWLAGIDSKLRGLTER
jgi:formiminotetrahydrofolate cyclodeaminase